MSRLKIGNNKMDKFRIKLKYQREIDLRFNLHFSHQID